MPRYPSPKTLALRDRIIADYRPTIDRPRQNVTVLQLMQKYGVSRFKIMNAISMMNRIPFTLLNGITQRKSRVKDAILAYPRPPEDWIPGDQTKVARSANVSVSAVQQMAQRMMGGYTTTPIRYTRKIID